MYNQEYIVDEIIKKDLIKEHPELKKLIRTTSPHEVRGGIMSVLDKNRRVHRDIKFYENLNKECEYNTYTDEIVVNVRKYIEVADCEVKEFGEVMTPIWLVEDMLNKLPDEVWSNKDLKWLDPCAGVGTFPSVIVQRLMKGLKTQIPNPKKRYKHIIEEMIYVCELQAKNLFAFHYVFDKPNIYELNTFYGSFLTDKFNEHMKNEWGIDKFDIVIGNPPYNNSQNSQGKRGGGDTLWDKFVIKIINNSLKKNGLLCFVHPTLWRKPQSEKSSVREVSELMRSKQIHYLEMHNSEDGIKTFNAGTRYDFYVLENSSIYKTTKINDEDRKNISLTLNDISFIPNKKIDFISSLISNENDLKSPIIFNRTNYGSDKEWVSDEKTAEYKYPLIHSTPKSGVRYKYSSRKDNGHFGISKVIFGDSGIYDVIIDMEGKYGMTQHSMAIEVSSLKEANDLKKVLMSDKFNEFLECVMWSNFQLDWRLFSYLKKDFYKQFLND